MKRKKVVLISCSKQKQRSKIAIKAKYLYTSDLFKKSLEYAYSLNPDKIFILSAKYGLLNLDKKINYYDKYLKNYSLKQKEEWNEKVKRQLKRNNCDVKKDNIIFIAGKEYTDFIKNKTKNIEYIFKNHNFGKRKQILKKKLLKYYKSFKEKKEPIFSNWIKWKEREEAEKIDKPGIYFIAKGKPKNKANILPKKIIYIGETCDNSLKGRWKQFDNSAFKKKNEHSGGNTYREKYVDKGTNLYVAYLAISDLGEIHRSLFIRFIERKMIWNYVLKWGKNPTCNKK